MEKNNTIFIGSIHEPITNEDNVKINFSLVTEETVIKCVNRCLHYI